MANHKSAAKKARRDAEARLRNRANRSAMKSTLEHLVHCCHGDERPECPILDGLADRDPVVPGAHGRPGGIAARRHGAA